MSGLDDLSVSTPVPGGAARRHALGDPATSHFIAIQGARWLLVPLAALFGATTLAMLVAAATWFTVTVSGQSLDGSIATMTGPAIESAAFGWAWTRIACTMAPGQKSGTATIMVLLLFVAIAAIDTLAYLQGGMSYGEAARRILDAVLMLAAASSALVPHRG